MGSKGIDIELLEGLLAAFHKLRAGKCNPEEVQALVAVSNTAVKWAEFRLKLLSAKDGGKEALRALQKANYVDPDIAINTGKSSEYDTVKCTAKEDAIITRQECLDYSGSHLDECRDCDHFKTTREVLIDGR